MRKLFTLLAFVITTNIYSQATPPIDYLVAALIEVESRGDSSAIGDGGRAVGSLQIHTILVRDVNRILGKQNSDKRFSYSDRYSEKKSIEMFHIWRAYYHTNSSWETIARCWNGGPNGASMYATKKYWNKVNYELSELYYYD